MLRKKQVIRVGAIDAPDFVNVSEPARMMSAVCAPVRSSNVLMAMEEP
jgi:hypothetical protein